MPSKEGHTMFEKVSANPAKDAEISLFSTANSAMNAVRILTKLVILISEKCQGSLRCIERHTESQTIDSLGPVRRMCKPRNISAKKRILHNPNSVNVVKHVLEEFKEAPNALRTMAPAMVSEYMEYSPRPSLGKGVSSGGSRKPRDTHNRVWYHELIRKVE
jgi:hypothetical protein